MTEATKPEISCTNCGACCRGGALLALTDKEAEFLVEGKTNLTVLFTAGRREFWQKFMAGKKSENPGEQLLINFMTGVTEGNGAYLLEADCGYLDNDARCTIYNDPRRPKKCAEFETGSPACISMRAARGIESPGAISLPMPTIRPSSSPRKQ